MRLSEKKKRQKIHILSFVMVMIIFCAVMALTFFSGKKDNMYLSSADKEYFEQGWTYQGEDGKVPVTEFPVERKEKEGNFFAVLPETLQKGDTFVFENTYQKVEVLVDGRQIYQYGYDTKSPYFITGKINCIVKLGPEYAGKTMEVHILSDDALEGIVFHPGYIAAGSSLAGEILGDNIWAFLFCIAGGSSVVVMLLLACYQLFQKERKNFLIFLHLGLFMLFSSVWVFTDSSLPQLLFWNNQAIMILSFEVFMLMPVPLLLFIRQICKGKQKILLFMEQLFLVNFMTQNVLYLLKISNFVKMIMGTHIIMLVCFGTVAFCLVKECIAHHSTYAKWALLGISFLGIAGCLSMVPFYTNNGETREQIFIVGFLAFMLVMILLSFCKFQEYSEVSARAGLFQELAYKDMMTGMENRTSYEKKLAEYNQVENDARSVSVLLFDVDDLKEINDNYGHRAGDQLVKDAAKCIRQAYARQGECFRIGGDEFVAVLWDEEINPERYREDLDFYIERCNVSRLISMSISVGCSVRCANSDKNLNIGRMVEMADERMYEEKRRYHERKHTSLA